MNTATTTLKIEGSIHFARKGRGAQRVLEAGPAPTPPEPGRVPRVARLMALALRFDRLVREGTVRDYAELARLGRVTRARMTQVMALLNLATDIQETLLFLPKVERGRDPLVLRDLQPIAAATDWKKQRKLWAALGSANGNRPR